MAFACFLFVFLNALSDAAEIELLPCDPPDLPIWGGYGPQQDEYLPGDIIHYYCDIDTYIGGNFLRRCEDSGDWTGDTPVCDGPTAFSSTSQSSSTDDQSGSEFAVDGIRSTCTSTIGGEKEEWSGIFKTPGELIRVMLFLPRGPASYEVVMIKQNNEEITCGSQTANIDRLDWIFHNCPQPHNVNIKGLKIKSLSNDPLRICEIAAHVLTSPKCVDPHVHIESGRLRMNRKIATLVCDRGFTRSSDAKIECIRDGVWTRKTLYCIEREWEMDPSGTNNRRGPDNEPRQQNPERERISV